MALIALGYQANTRHGYGPLGLGLVAVGVGVGVGVVLISKFVLASTPFLYLGLGLLIAASLWNAWPRKTVASDSCSTCARQGLEVISPSEKERNEPC